MLVELNQVLGALPEPDAPSAGSHHTVLSGLWPKGAGIQVGCCWTCSCQGKACLIRPVCWGLLASQGSHGAPALWLVHQLPSCG